jgi:two-component system, chemotaxis family, sensor kinase CheA
MDSSEKEMLDLFVQESSEHLEALEQDLVALESNPQDKALLNRIFRAVHSVKGTSGFFGLTNISQLAHTMESIMALVREGQMLATADMVDAFLQAGDKLRLMVNDPANSAGVETSENQARLKAYLEVKPAAVEPAPGKSTPVAVPPPACVAAFRLDPELVRAGIEHGHNFFILSIRLRTDIENAGRNVLDYLREIESLGVYLDVFTDIADAPDLGKAFDAELVSRFLFSTQMEQDLLCGAFDLPSSQIEAVPTQPLKAWVLVQPKIVPAAKFAAPAPQAAPAPNLMPGVSPAKSAPQPAPVPAPALAVAPPFAQAKPVPATPVAPAPAAAKSAAARPADETIRISVQLLDSLMNLAGEMVLGRNQLSRLAVGLERERPGLSGVIQNINAVTTDLQETVMRTRLQAVGGLFTKFNRVVRDLGQKLSKELSLEIVGEDVELDRTLIEGLSDPLTHLVRNCCDHAIETPDEREQAGKPRAGNIKLTAAHSSGRVLIEVRDDGRGLNPDKLKSKALEKGLITAEHAARMPDDEARKLIFLPGFSTAAQVSDVSGRGVGMDVVRTNIEKLGGNVELDSAVGQGTAVIIRLPLTLAIVPALLVTSRERRFAVPQVNLEEIVRIGGDRKLEHIGGVEVLRLRDELLPVVSLGHVLDLPLQERGDTYLLVLRVEKQRFGLLVDQVADTEEIVVKPLGKALKGVGLYSGATILGDGHVAMILDAAGVARAAGVSSRGPINAPKVATAADQGEKQSILLFNIGGEETLALHLANIARIERVDVQRIERVGEKEFFRTGEQVIELIHLERHIPVRAPQADRPELLHVIVPKLMRKTIGIVAHQILDAVDVAATLDTRAIQARGVLGTCHVQDRLTVFLDLYDLLATVDPEPQKSADIRQTLANTRVLYAEDTAFFREIVARALRPHVREIVVANDGALALKRLEAGEFDLVLTDIEMPNMDGFELARRIRSSPRLRHLPIVALSSRGTQQFRQRGQEAGITRYENKLDQERLQRVLAEVLGGAPAPDAPLLAA